MPCLIQQRRCYFDGLRTARQLQIVDAESILAAFVDGGLLDPALFRSQLGGLIEKMRAGRTPCPVRAYGEMVDLLLQDQASVEQHSRVLPMEV